MPTNGKGLDIHELVGSGEVNAATFGEHPTEIIDAMVDTGSPLVIRKSGRAAAFLIPEGTTVVLVQGEPDGRQDEISLGSTPTA